MMAFYCFAARVSMAHQNASALTIFTLSKESEYENRALCLRKLAFVLWSSEKDQHSKFLTNIQGLCCVLSNLCLQVILFYWLVV